MQNAECRVQNGAKCTMCRNKGYCIICDSCIHEPERKDNFEPLTNGDRIRAMSDEELVEMLYNGVDAEYCRNAPECGEMLDADDGIPEEKCKGCLLNWLRQPVKEEST